MARKTLSRRDFLRVSALSVTGAALAGCAVATPTPAPEPTEAPTEAPPAAEPVTIRFITHWAGEDAHGPIVERLVEKFADAHPEIILDAQLISDWGTVSQKYQAECAAGDCPDVAFDGFSGGPNAVDAGQLLPADDFVEAHKDIIDFESLGAKYADHYYSGFAEELNGYVVVYSKPLLTQIGLDEFPKTWDDLLAAGEAVKEAGKVLTSLSNWTNYLFYTYVQQSTDAGLQASIDGDWDSPTWLESMKHFAELLPYLDPNDMELDFSAIPLSVGEGSMLFDINGPWMVGNLNMDVEQVANAIGGAPLPTPGGPLMIGGSGYAISMTAFNTGHPERVAAVWTFYDYWITDEEIVKGFITDARSPMGVHTEWITEDNCGPALWAFMDPMYNAGDKGFQMIGEWSKVNTGEGVKAAFQALRLGQDAEDALQELMAIVKPS